MVAKGQVLEAGQSLDAVDFLVSASGQYSAVMQSDGNFVVYWGSPTTNLIGPMWVTDTQGQRDSKEHPVSAIMQGDGNFVVYQGSTVLWASNTDRKTSVDCFAVMQDDGNFVLYERMSDHTVKSFWATGTDIANVWVKCNAGYIARAHITQGSEVVASSGDIDVPQCRTLAFSAARNSILYLVYMDLNTEKTACTYQLGSIRAKRFEMTGMFGLIPDCGNTHMIAGRGCNW